MKQKSKSSKFILGICASNSGSGKTFLIENLLPQLKKKGLNVSVIKHAHHTFDIDTPGKDSFRIRKAGAFQTLVFNKERAALITEAGDNSFSLDKAINQIDSSTDIILIEGLKNMLYPKIEVYRKGKSLEKLYDNDTHIIAVASDHPLNSKIPCLDLNNIDEIINFIVKIYNNE